MGKLSFFVGTAAVYGLARDTVLALIDRSNTEILGAVDRAGTRQQLCHRFRDRYAQ